MPRIKISGITNIEDAKWAAILGVEFVSISLDEDSDKKVSFSRAKEIRDILPSYTGFVAEFGEVSRINPRHVNKLQPGYIQVKNETMIDADNMKSTLEGLNSQVIYEITNQPPDPEGMDSQGAQPDETNIDEGMKLLQIDLPEAARDEKKLLELKEKYDMEHTIIEGDWKLSEIKKACEILQPYAWSIKGVIEKSPRKIDYKMMKEYIREISLW